MLMMGFTFSGICIFATDDALHNNTSRPADGPANGLAFAGSYSSQCRRFFSSRYNFDDEDIVVDVVP